jgi:hypothetical protein
MACTRASPLASSGTSPIPARRTRRGKRDVQFLPTVVPVCDGLLYPVITIVGVSDDHVPATDQKALRRAPWLMTGEHDELVNTTETGPRARQRRVH